MPLVTVELRSGNITKVGIDPEITLRKVALVHRPVSGSFGAHKIRYMKEGHAPSFFEFCPTAKAIERD